MSIENEIDDGLTDEEREALELQDDEEAGNDADTGEDNDDGEGNEDAGEGEDGADDDNDAGDDGDDDTDEGDGDQPGRDDGSEDDTKANEQAPAKTSAPILVAEAPADAEEKLKEIADKKAEVLQKFEDGDLTTAEYHTELDALNKQEREIERAVDRANLAAEMEQTRRLNEWKRDCDAFLDANPIYKEKPRLYEMMDKEVRTLGADPANANLTGPQLLAKAHQNLVDDGIVPATKKADGKKAATKQKTDLPPSLHSVPAAEVSETGGNRFANLDRLAQTDPIKYEEALMRLPDAEREAYLAQG